MAELKVELNSSGIREYLQSKSVQDMLESQAQQIAKRCGDGYDVDVYVGKTRANASVQTTSKDAYQQNLKSNKMLKAMK